MLMHILNNTIQAFLNPRKSFFVTLRVAGWRVKFLWCHSLFHLIINQLSNLALVLPVMLKKDWNVAKLHLICHISSIFLKEAERLFLHKSLPSIGFFPISDSLFRVEPPLLCF